MLLVFPRSPGPCLPTHISGHSTGPGWPVRPSAPPENGRRVLTKTGFPGGVRYRISVGLLRKQYVPKSGTGPWGSGFCNCRLTLLGRPSRPASSAHPCPPTPGQHPYAAAPPLPACLRPPASLPIVLLSACTPRVLRLPTHAALSWGPGPNNCCLSKSEHEI